MALVSPLAPYRMRSGRVAATSAAATAPEVVTRFPVHVTGFSEGWAPAASSSPLASQWPDASRSVSSPAAASNSDPVETLITTRACSALAATQATTSGSSIIRIEPSPPGMSSRSVGATWSTPSVASNRCTGSKPWTDPG